MVGNFLCSFRLQMKQGVWIQENIICCQCYKAATLKCCCSTQQEEPISPNHTCRPLIKPMARCYNTVTGQSCKWYNQHTRCLMSCWVIAILLFIITGEPQKGVSGLFCSPPVRGDVWTSVRVWGALPLWEAAHSLPLLHLVSSGPLLAAVEGRATAEGFVLIEEQLNQQESQPRPAN